MYFIQCQKQYSIKNIKKIYKANTNTNTSAKKAGIAKLISVELDIKKKSINRNKGRYIMIKGTIHHDDVTVLNFKALNNTFPNYTL